MLRRLAGAVVIAACIAACSEPPLKERHQAEGALAAARAADAEIYAADQLRAAEAALEKYDSAVAQHDYRQALNYALDARDRAYDAAKEAGNEKAALRSQAELLLSDLESLTKTGNARLAGTAGARPTGAAAERLRSALHAAPAALQEARSLLEHRDYRGAVNRLTPVVAAFRRELEPAGGPARRGRG
jgi:hypothetical protein